jgi:hypothetical protein
MRIDREMLYGGDDHDCQGIITSESFQVRSLRFGWDLGVLRAARALALEDEGTAAPFTFHPQEIAPAAIAAEAGSSTTKEQIIRNYYSGWERQEWSAIESLLADSFTFTSPNGDDHLNKVAFKARCWGEAEFIERFELESVREGENEAFVKYLCRTKKNTSFRNVEYFRFAGGKIGSIEVYFGGNIGHPSQNA